MKRPRTKFSPKTSYSSASAAAEFFASIDDLLIQVFHRIPLKQLFRFKIVSKHWNSIISDPKLNLTLRKQAVGLIFNCRLEIHPDVDNSQSFVLYFNKPMIPKPMREPLSGHRTKVLHSCNGLLLCKSVFGSTWHYVYNPITKKSSILDPGTGPLYLTDSICGMYLAFDPSESCHYKFVCVVGLEDDWFMFEVYSSETGSWRRYGEPFLATDVDFEEGGVYWKGAIHWVSSRKAGNSIYFNPSACDDRMLPMVMPSPPILEDVLKKVRRNYHFGESCGHLHFIDAHSKVFEFNVYEMKCDYSEWFVKYRVDLSNVVSGFFRICTLVRGNKDDDSFLVLRIGNKFTRCNLVDRACETIYECKGNTLLEEELLKPDAKLPLQYIEGVYVSLDGIWATEEERRSQKKHRTEGLSKAWSVFKTRWFR